jgi:hypothetical protein
VSFTDIYLRLARSCYMNANETFCKFLYQRNKSLSAAHGWVGIQNSIANSSGDRLEAALQRRCNLLPRLRWAKAEAAVVSRPAPFFTDWV